MRRRRKNPSIGVAIFGATIVAAVGATLAFLLRDKVETQFQEGAPAFTGMSQRDADTLELGDCITAVNGVAGFRVQGINIGENVSLKVLQPGRGGPLLAMLNDPRVPAGQAPFQIPATAISGAATPGVEGC